MAARSAQNSATRLRLTADDTRLTELCLQGDPAAWSRFVKRFEPAIYRRAYLVIRNREDAEDVVSETFERIYKGLGTFRADSHLVPWVLRIAQNTAITFLRRKQSQPPAVSLNQIAGDTIPQEFDLPDSSAGPDEQIIASETQGRITNSIKHLSGYQRGAFDLHVIEGMPIVDVAHTMGIPVGTVKSRIARARKLLRERFELN